MQRRAQLRDIRWMPSPACCGRRLGAAILILLLSFHTVFAGKPGMGKGEMPPPVVKVATITEKEINPAREYVGRIEPIQAVDLRARVSGNLERVKFKEGSHVEAGDLLYLIEQSAYKANVSANTAKVAEAKTTLTRARQYREGLEVVKSGGVSKTDLETARASEQEAQSRLDEAQANLIQSKLDLTYTTIKAPISGRIGATNFTRGNLVGPDSGTLARIIQLDPIRVVYSISENDLISAKQQIKSLKKDRSEAKEQWVPRIRLSNGTLYPIDGRIDFAGNEVDSRTGTIPVRASFENPDSMLLPGQYVTVLISPRNPEKKPMVPQSAVIEDREGRYVFVVGEDKKVQQRRITTGAAVETEWAVEEGLSAGETVVISGVQKVRPGQVVSPVTESTSQAAKMQ